MSPRAAHQPPPPPQTPLPVRLADMSELEAAYLAASPDERLALHLKLTYYTHLTDDERFALERRFPNELAGEPTAPDATEGTRVAWDLRSRELIVCMLQYGERVLTARMDLVRQVEPADDVAVIAMTATGSFLELGRPRSDGTRSFVYRASARPRGGRKYGEVKLEVAVKLGNPVVLGDLHTSELLAVAAGREQPKDDDTIPGGTILFGPVYDEPKPQLSDPLRIGVSRFRVLVDAAENAKSPEEKLPFQTRAATLARDLQRRISPMGGYALSELASFTTGSGAKYEVMQHDGLDLVRRDPEGGDVRWLTGADIGEQTVVVGTPLVVFHSGVRGAKNVAFVFRVAAVTRRPDVHDGDDSP